jgi:dCTP deaminase
VQERQLFPELDTSDPSPLVHSAGILPCQNITELLDSRVIFAERPIAPEQIQPASLDLRLSSKAYRIQASFLPNKAKTVMSKLRDMLDRAEAVEIDLSKPAILERGCVYIALLAEELLLPDDIWGKANPKSTTGRLDVLTRLITDYSREFEKVEPGYRGPLYAEIFPSTFSIVVREGTRLNQLRLIRGKPVSSDKNLGELDKEHPLLFREDQPGKPQISNGLWLSVDLEGNGGDDPIAYEARQESPIIDFDKRHHYPRNAGWNPIPRCDRNCLILERNRFYLLASKERIRIPPTHAAELIAYDPSFGEFRIHYAGFFDPGFGCGDEHHRGSRAVLEVRSHNVPFLLEDGQIVGRLVFERLLCPPTRLYGTDIGSSYQNQNLALGKQFKLS